MTTAQNADPSTMRRLIARLEEYHEDLKRKIVCKERMINALIVQGFRGGHGGATQPAASSSTTPAPAPSGNALFDRFPRFSQFIAASSSQAKTGAASTPTRHSTPDARRLSIHKNVSAGAECCDRPLFSPQRVGGGCTMDRGEGGRGEGVGDVLSPSSSLMAADSVTFPLTAEQRRLGLSLSSTANASSRRGISVSSTLPQFHTQLPHDTTPGLANVSPIEDARISDDQSLACGANNVSSAHTQTLCPSGLDNPNTSRLKRVRFSSNSPQVAIISVDRFEEPAEPLNGFSERVTTAPSSPKNAVEQFLESINQTRRSLEESFGSTVTRLSSCAAESPVERHRSTSLLTFSPCGSNNTASDKRAATEACSCDSPEYDFGDTDAATPHRVIRSSGVTAPQDCNQAPPAQNKADGEEPYSDAGSRLSFHINREGSLTPDLVDHVNAPRSTPGAEGSPEIAFDDNDSLAAVPVFLHRPNRRRQTQRRVTEISAAVSLGASINATATTHFSTTSSFSQQNMSAKPVVLVKGPSTRQKPISLPPAKKRVKKEAHQPPKRSSSAAKVYRDDRTKGTALTKRQLIMLLSARRAHIAANAVRQECGSGNIVLACGPTLFF